MPEVPAVVRPIVRRLARRLAAGLFLDLWPRWAAGSLVAAATTALVCRVFAPAAAPYLAWLWLAPIVTALPVALLCLNRAYRPSEVAAIADSLSGGNGVLLALVERPDAAWTATPLVQRVSQLRLPRLRPWRRLAVLLPAAAALLAALLLPQRLPASGSPALAEELAADLTATLDLLQERDLITPEEEDRLAEEIERVRAAARERMDASAWESADALRERMAAMAAARLDAAEWAEAAAERAAAAAAGLDPADTAAAAALAAELSQAIEALEASGLLAGAPADIQQMLGAAGTLPSDPGALSDLASSLAEYLEGLGGRFADVPTIDGTGGRFDPSEFPLDEPDFALNGDGDPGAGGVNRGRGDAALTWGDESLPADRFEALPLPPGRVRGPDDWSPVMTLPGAPQEAPERSAPRPRAPSATRRDRPPGGARSRPGT